MKPKHRNRRMVNSLLAALIILTGTVLLLKALGDNKQLFINPSNVVSLDYIQGVNPVKVGGLVVDGSITKPDSLNTQFMIINFDDANPEIPSLEVHYKGVLPDLFREGQGVVLTGKLKPNGVFEASSVLAKHDENYMPKMPKS